VALRGGAHRMADRHRREHAVARWAAAVLPLPLPLPPPLPPPLPLPLTLPLALALALILPLPLPLPLPLTLALALALALTLARWAAAVHSAHRACEATRTALEAFPRLRLALQAAARA
jgi:hypothetical protein